MPLSIIISIREIEQFIVGVLNIIQNRRPYIFTFYNLLQIYSLGQNSLRWHRQPLLYKLTLFVAIQLHRMNLRFFNFFRHSAFALALINHDAILIQKQIREVHNEILVHLTHRSQIIVCITIIDTLNIGVFQKETTTFIVFILGNI